MQEKSKSRWHLLWVLPPVILGVLFLAWMKGGKQPPVKTDQPVVAPVVRVVEAREIALQPRAEGFGPVQPARVWTAVAQVSGRVSELHARLRDGEILPRDTLLYRIDPVDYELVLAQARAELAELDVREKNARASLDIEKRNLRVAERELSRFRDLAAKGTASRSDADNAERTVLATRASVQNASNTLELIPTQRSVLEGKVSQAERDLQHTEIRAPFNLRVANLKIEADQYVSKGETLFQGDGVDRVEVVAQVSMSALRNLFLDRDIHFSTAVVADANLASLVSLRPRLHLDLGRHTAEWDAEFVRFSDTVDPETRTLGVVVAVDKPFEKVIPGYRPPLSKGMFVEVSLQGPRIRPRVVLPRSSVHGGQVYVLDQEQTLEIRQVEILFTQDRYSVIANGVSPAETVVISNLVPAVPGMRLRGEADRPAEQALADLAGDGA